MTEVDVPGWCASLDLRLQDVDGRTRITHREHRGPIQVQRAFYPEGTYPEVTAAPTTALPTTEPCHVYVIHPPGGFASGDVVQLNATVAARAHALITTPAAGKFYRRGAAGVARLVQTLRVAGTLDWVPQENIFYPNAAAEITSVVRLSAGARFIGWEIAAFGFPASGRSLESGHVRQSFELWLDDRPLLLERLMIDRTSLSARWGLANRSSMGTWLGFPAGSADLLMARAVTDKGCGGSTVACTLVDGVLVCRGLAARTDELKRVFIGLWHALRPVLAGRNAVVPRVWAT